MTTVKDENEPIIRLADAVAGASAVLEKYKNEEIRQIFLSAEENLSYFKQKTTRLRGGQPILPAGWEAAWHTQQFSAVLLLLVFNRKPPQSRDGQPILLTGQ